MSGRAQGTSLDASLPDRSAPVPWSRVPVRGFDGPDVLPGAPIGACSDALEHIAEASRVLNALGTRVSRALESIPNPLVGGSHISPRHVSDWQSGRVKRHLRHAGAFAIDGYHQSLHGYPVKRGAFPRDPFWLFDVRFR